MVQLLNSQSGAEQILFNAGGRKGAFSKDNGNLDLFFFTGYQAVVNSGPDFSLLRISPAALITIVTMGIFLPALSMPC